MKSWQNRLGITAEDVLNTIERLPSEGTNCETLWFEDAGQVLHALASERSDISQLQSRAFNILKTSKSTFGSGSITAFFNHQLVENRLDEKTRASMLGHLLPLLDNAAETSTCPFLEREAAIFVGHAAFAKEGHEEWEALWCLWNTMRHGSLEVREVSASSLAECIAKKPSIASDLKKKVTEMWSGDDVVDQACYKGVLWYGKVVAKLFTTADLLNPAHLGEVAKSIVSAEWLEQVLCVWKCDPSVGLECFKQVFDVCKWHGRTSLLRDSELQPIVAAVEKACSVQSCTLSWVETVKPFRIPLLCHFFRSCSSLSTLWRLCVLVSPSSLSLSDACSLCDAMYVVLSTTSCVEETIEGCDQLMQFIADLLDYCIRRALITLHTLRAQKLLANAVSLLARTEHLLSPTRVSRIVNHLDEYLCDTTEEVVEEEYVIACDAVVSGCRQSRLHVDSAILPALRGSFKKLVRHRESMKSALGVLSVLPGGCSDADGLLAGIKEAFLPSNLSHVQNREALTEAFMLAPRLPMFAVEYFLDYQLHRDFLLDEWELMREWLVAVERVHGWREALRRSEVCHPHPSPDIAKLVARWKLLQDGEVEVDAAPAKKQRKGVHSKPDRFDRILHFTLDTPFSVCADCE
mmetsp:Transcript_48103/g.125094  ORF Transcript_48103/g.125094 Transcript_48103/m.125094 type:complete len:634 (-) Transcript_48103:199-2100(-)